MNFTGEEVLSNDFAKKKRVSDLYRAMILGNLYHVKCRIVFETKKGLRDVETTVWAATDKFVSLKGGISIPVGCIHQVIV
ncbi:MAG: hypothetical protein NTX03_08345 [Bacteroidetes bacterium]|nr:hypothetical protein [Bacteroidota bacterium]